MAEPFHVFWTIAIEEGKDGKLNRKIKRYLDEIDRTEKKIMELQQYLKGVRVALREEENNEMIKSIRGMKLQGKELFQLLNGIQDGSISFVMSEESEEETGSFIYNEKQEEREEENYGEMEENQ